MYEIYGGILIFENSFVVLDAELGLAVMSRSAAASVGVKGVESGGKLRLLRRPFHPDVQFLRIHKRKTPLV
jgi:hypothetical protein